MGEHFHLIGTLLLKSGQVYALYSAEPDADGARYQSIINPTFTDDDGREHRSNIGAQLEMAGVLAFGPNYRLVPVGAGFVPPRTIGG